MALISTLRQRMGKIVVGGLAFSMLAFILTDLFQSNSSLFGGSENVVAEIAGSEISYQSFTQKVDELAAVFALNYRRNPSSEDLQRIREQAWNALIVDYAYENEIQALGLEVTNAEIVDMVQGNNISPQIRQFFTNPNTGVFDRDQVIQTLQGLSSAPAQQRQSWYTFEATLSPSRKIQKYDNLFDKSNYVTQAEAKSLYTAQNSTATVDYFYVPFFSVKDSAVSYTQSDLEDYLSDHEADFQREEARSLYYVSVPVNPSAADSAYIWDEITNLRDGLISAQDDSLYVTINSDASNAYQSIADPSLIPEEFLVDGEIVEIGTTTEPVLVGEKYIVSKLSSISEGEEAFVKGSHILIKGEDDEAEKKAKDLLRKLKRGADFAELAAENSEDRSNSANGGDLGWFGENGSFVQEFKDAAFSFKGTGLIPEPVKTSFGYHIIRIDEPKTNTVYNIAKIEKELFASDATMNDIYRIADGLASGSSSAASLKENAEAAGYRVRTATNVGKNETRIGTLTNARNIVSWLYNKAEKGSGAISQVFELDDSYVVAALTNIQEKGTAQLSQVEGEVRIKVLNEKKAAYILNKIKGLSSEDFEALKGAYGTEARTGTADLSLSSNSFPGVGLAPEAVGVAFSLKEGEQTQPFAITNGVILLAAQSNNTPETLENYDPYKSSVISSRSSRKMPIADFPLAFYPMLVNQRLDNAVKEFAEIEDNRYKFY